MVNQFGNRLFNKFEHEQWWRWGLIQAGPCLQNGCSQVFRLIRRDRASLQCQCFHQLYLVIIYKLSVTFAPGHNDRYFSCLQNMKQSAGSSMADHKVGFRNHCRKLLHRQKTVLLTAQTVKIRSVARLNHNLLLTEDSFASQVVHGIQ